MQKKAFNGFDDINLSCKITFKGFDKTGLYYKGLANILLTDLSIKVCCRKSIVQIDEKATHNYIILYNFRSL